MTAIQKRLVDDWRQAWRWWSVRMTAIGTLLGGALAIMPSMPAEVQAMIPTKYRLIAVGLWAMASLYSRVAKQRAPGA